MQTSHSEQRSAVEDKPTSDEVKWKMEVSPKAPPLLRQMNKSQSKKKTVQPVFVPRNREDPSALWIISYHGPLPQDISFHPKVALNALNVCPCVAGSEQPGFYPHTFTEANTLLWGIPGRINCVWAHKCPRWQFIHYSWMNEINSLCLSPTTVTLQRKEIPNSPQKPLYKQHNRIPWFSHLAWPSTPDFTGSRLCLCEELKYTGNVISIQVAREN